MNPDERPRKREFLADDNTTLMLQTSENFSNLRTILDEFAAVSGLHCNYDKTCVLLIGPTDPTINLHGFIPTEKIKLLGFEVTKNFENTDDTFGEIHEKIKGLISFWECFRLTLPGRISVIKNLLIPQLNYLGCILEPSKRVLDSIQSSLDTFALQGQQVSGERRYLDPENGGLGLFELKTFLDAQKCSWIKRAFQKTIDNWRFDLKNLAPDQNILNIRKIDVSYERNPILYNLVCAFTSFTDGFYLKDENFKESAIFLNLAFVRSGTDSGLLDIPFFTREIYEQCKSNIRKLTFTDCFVNSTFRDQASFRQDGIDLTGTVWTRLRNAILHAKKTLPNRDTIKK
jgi:hypothetical protein